MKFLILKTQNPEPHDVRFRVFLEDGTELHGTRRIAISGQPEQHFVTRHSIDEPLTDKLFFQVTGLELEFASADIEMIDEAPQSLETRLRSLAAKWTQNHGGYCSNPADAAVECAEAECAAELLGLLDEVKQ